MDAKKPTYKVVLLPLQLMLFIEIIKDVSDVCNVCHWSNFNLPYTFKTPFILNSILLIYKLR